MRKLSGVWDEKDAVWTLQLHRAAAPLLEELVELTAGDAGVFAVLGSMTRLRRLDARALPDTHRFQVAEGVGLRWLQLGYGVSRQTLTTLIEKYGPTLRVLELKVGTYKRSRYSRWPLTAWDLDMLDAKYLKKVEVIILRRNGCKHETHGYDDSTTTCFDQVQGLKGKLNRGGWENLPVVLCESCDCSFLHYLQLEKVLE